MADHLHGLTDGQDAAMRKAAGTQMSTSLMKAVQGFARQDAVMRRVAGTHMSTSLMKAVQGFARQDAAMRRVAGTHMSTSLIKAVQGAERYEKAESPEERLSPRGNRHLSMPRLDDWAILVVLMSAFVLLGVTFAEAHRSSRSGPETAEGFLSWFLPLMWLLLYLKGDKDERF